VLYFIVGDHLGTTSLVLNAQGDKVAGSRHFPYGGERWSSGTLPTDYHFTGQRFDSYIKLTVMDARWYDAQLGRWISPDTIIPDPANPQSLNRFAYVRGNPLRYVDPTGHQEEPWWLKIGRAIGSSKLGKALVVNSAEAWWGATTHVHQAAQGTAIAADILAENPLGDYRPSLPEGTDDLTGFLLEQMNNNANSAVAQGLMSANSGGLDQRIAADLGWMALVKGGGPWDFKPDILRQVGKKIDLAGGTYRYDIAANIHYGYVGRASGFSSNALLNGAGIAQIRAGTSSLTFLWTRFDSPFDQAAIQVGIYLYEKYGNVQLTEEMLWQALQLLDWDALAQYEASLLGSPSE
jgi:RHS repeat-associated protein